MTRASMRANTMDTRVTVLEGSVLEIQSSVATISSTMQNLSNVIASMESRFAALETHFSGADHTRRDHFDHGDSSNPVGGSEEPLSDPMVHMVHQSFIKSTSPLSLEKSNEIVLKLQSFHKEKVRAREKRDELWSQFHPRYKPQTRPCLRPILKKFKRVRCSHQCSEFPSYQPLKREDLNHGNKSRPCFVSEKLEAHDMIQGFLQDETLAFGCKKIWVTEIGEEIYPFRSKPATILESDCKNGKSQVFILEIHVSNVGFYKTELPGSRALYLFDKKSTSGYILDIKLGYHMSIRDKGGTNFLFSFESINLLASCKDSGFCVVIHRFMGYYYKGILDKGGTISQRLFNSKSNNKDCVLGSDCSKVFQCEGIRDKGGGSKFRKSADDEEQMVNLYFNRIGWPSSLSTNEKESFVKNVLQKKKMAMDEFLMSEKLTLRPGVEEFIDDAYTEGIHVVVLTTYSQSGDQIGRSIVEKLGEERISKLKIVRDTEVDLSLYTQLVNDTGLSFGVDEQLAKEAIKAVSAEKQRIAEEVASMLQLSVNIDTSPPETLEKIIAAFRVGGEVAGLHVCDCVLISNTHFSCLNEYGNSIDCSQDRMIGVVMLVAYTTCIVVGGEFYSSNIELSRVRMMIVPIVREEYLVLSFHRPKKFPFGSSVHGSFGLPDTSHILEDGILTGRRMTTPRDHSCEYDEHKKVDAAFTGAKHMPKQMIYNNNSKFSIISEYKDVVDGAWISHENESSVSRYYQALSVEGT